MSKHRLTKGSVRRSLAIGAAGALFLTVLPGTAFAQSRGTQDVCPPPGETATDQFPDDDNNVHEDNIDCVAMYDIAQGFDDGTYRPSLDITRAQMATFIAEFVRTAGAELPAGTDAFPDDDGNVHENNINAIANAGIVTGYPDGTYRPGESVTRDQMATYIANAIDYRDDTEVNGSIPPEPTADYFVDDEGNVHENNINRLAEQNIVAGTNVSERLYSPKVDVSRAQMTTFIMQAADYLAELGLWAPFAQVTVTGVPDEVEQGEEVTATVQAPEGTTIASVRVLGCGVDETFTTDEDATADDFQVTFTIPADQAEGECVIRFIVTDEDGNQLEERVTVTVIAPTAAPTNQDFTVTPQDQTVETGDVVEFTATNITSDTVDIALFACADVTTTDGTVTFADANNDNLADRTATDAVIIEVNGVAGSYGDHVDNVTVTDGSVTFEVTSNTEECIVAVVWNDADDDERVDLDANDEPTEEFGVSGEITFAAVAALDAEPEFEVNRFGETHTVTASLVDADGDLVAVDGDRVRFALYLIDSTDDDIDLTTTGGEFEGPCTGGTLIDAETVTVTDGTAEYTFTQADPNTAADSNDYEFCVEADAIDRTLGGDETDYVAKVFTDDAAEAAALNLTPETDTNLVETQHTVTATVTDQFGDPIDTAVTFEVHREGATNPVFTTVRTTGSDGVVTFTYTGPETTEDDVIVACVDEDAPADGCDATVTFNPDSADTGTTAEVDDFALKYWVEEAEAVVFTCADVIGFDTEANYVDVQVGTDNFRLFYDQNDQFAIDGSPSTMTAFETALSLDDELDAEYDPAAEPDVFNLEQGGC